MKQTITVLILAVNCCSHISLCFTSCQQQARIGKGYHSYSASASTSADVDSSKRTKRRKKKDNVGKKERMKKSEIDDLVRGIGLKPVGLDVYNDKQQQHPQSSNGVLSILDYQQSPLPIISLQTQLDYARNGHAVLRSFLPSIIIQQLHSELVPYATSNTLSAWKQKVEVQLADSSDEYYKDNARSIAHKLKTVEDCQDLLESLGLDTLSGDLPFLQHFNTWRSSSPDNNKNQTPTVRELCLSTCMAEAASILLNTPTIRLYQDSLFVKRVGDGWTPWHVDARMAPFDTPNMITFWVPLQSVPIPKKGGTGLLFVDGSHSDFALPYWNGVDGDEYDRLENRYGKDGGVSHHMPLDMGDVTVHNGWTLHCADAADYSEKDEDRYAFAITYVDGRAEVREDVLSSECSRASDKEDVWSFRSWVEEVKPRTKFRHPQVPIVWPPEQRDI